MLVFFKYQLSSYSRVAKTALQLLPAESDTQGKTHPVSRMQNMQFPLVLQKIIRLRLCPLESPTETLQGPGTWHEAPLLHCYC